ncbi:MAG: M28 family peptidase [Thermoguttaceae bacterium]
MSFNILAMCSIDGIEVPGQRFPPKKTSELQRRFEEICFSCNPYVFRLQSQNRPETNENVICPTMKASLYFLILIAPFFHGQHSLLAQEDSPLVSTVEQLEEHVRFLSDRELQGRQFGTIGAQKTAEYIANTLKEAGLKPGGTTSGWTMIAQPGVAQSGMTQSGERTGLESGNQAISNFACTSILQNPYFQLFSVEDTLGINVLAYIPGTDVTLAQEWIVLCAHYDHLGQRKGGAHYPGSNDNASGVAVLLELARHLTVAVNNGTLRLDRTVLFLFCDGEEKNLLGSRHFVRSLLDRWKRIREQEGEEEAGQKATVSAPPKIVCAVTLDMVGMLSEDRLEIVGQQSGTTWKELLDRANQNEELRFRWEPKMWKNSDHYAYYEESIPSLLLFTGLSGPYHTFEDTPELLSFSGMMRILNFVCEMVRELADSQSRLIPTWIEVTTRGLPSGVFNWGKTGKNCVIA